MQLGRHETFRGRFHSYNVVGSDENPNDGLINQYTDSLTHRFVDSSIRGLIPSRVPVIPPRHIYIYMYTYVHHGQKKREKKRGVQVTGSSFRSAYLSEGRQSISV